MEGRASIPVALPYDEPTLSYWQDPPASISHHRTTSELPQHVDIAIVGSGITGATTAFTLLDKPSPPSVLLLEARAACSGASGRNGGHAKHAHYREFVDNCEAIGEVEASKVARLEYNCMKAVHAFARTHRFNCDSWEGDTVDVIYDEGQWTKAKQGVGCLRRVLGDSDPAAQYTFWNSEETRSRFLAEGSLGAVSYEAGSLSAYKFVIGVLNLALERGLNLQTETPVLKLSHPDGKNGSWTIETSRGTVSARKVVLATNGYTAHLLPAIQGVIVPLRGHMTAQRPGRALPECGLTSTYSFIYDDGYEYMVFRPQGSLDAGHIMIGGGSTKALHAGLNEFGTTDDASTDDVILKYLEGCTETYFGESWGKDQPEGRLRNAWTGIMGYSADGFPLIGPVPEEENLYIAASFQGSGMVLSLLCARALVQMMTGADDEGLSQWFPTPFRMSPERLKHRFKGRLHTIVPMSLEVKAQI